MAPHLTESERRTLVSQLWASGHRNVQALWKATGFPKSTLYDHVRQLSQTGKLVVKPRPGRPKILTPKKQRHLARLATANREATSFEIAAKLNKTHPTLNVADRTIRENLF